MSNANLEISNILTLSTAHIEADTAIALDNNEINGIMSYEKKEYGWFIYTLVNDINSVPEDLIRVLNFALVNNCEWLCLDRDGDTTELLPTYEW